MIEVSQSSADVAVHQVPLHKRKRVLSPQAKQKAYDTQNLKRQQESAEFQAKWLNNELNVDELRDFDRKVELQKIANQKYKDSGKIPFRSPESKAKKDISDANKRNSAKLNVQAEPADSLAIGRIDEARKMRKPIDQANKAAINKRRRELAKVVLNLIFYTYINNLPYLFH